MISSQNAAALQEARRPPLLVTKRDAATMLSVCVRTVENLLSMKLLPHRKIGRRTLIPYSAVVAFARQGASTVAGHRQQPATASEPEPSDVRRIG